MPAINLNLFRIGNNFYNLNNLVSVKPQKDGSLGLKFVDEYVSLKSELREEFLALIEPYVMGEIAIKRFDEINLTEKSVG